MGASTIIAQSIVDFEELSLESESHWNGSDLNGSFTSEYLTFYNDFDETYSSWSGFAYTNETDNTTFSWENMYSSASGTGVYGSDNYVVSYVMADWMNEYQPIPSTMKLDLETMPETYTGMYLSLNAYANLYMEDADFYANNNHWLTLRITALSTTTYYFASQDIILADYRFENSEDGFKFDDWQYVDMSWAEGTDSLTFILLSSDSGDYGLNTPSYFCMDNFGEEAPVGVPQLVTELTDSHTISGGGSVELLALAKGGVQPYAYEWSGQEGLDMYNVANPTATPTITTTWTVTITDALGSESIETVTVNVGGVSIKDEINENLVVTLDAFENIFISSESKIDNIYIYDLTGKLILSESNLDQQAEIRFSHYPSGMYILNIVIEGQSVTRRIVK